MRIPIKFQGLRLNVDATPTEDGVQIEAMEFQGKDVTDLIADLYVRSFNGEYKPALDLIEFLVMEQFNDYQFWRDVA